MQINFEDFNTREGRQKFYQSKEWRNLREFILAREPMCRRCKAMGIIRGATDVDHIEDIIDRPENCLNADAVQPLCHKCHSRKTMRTRSLKTINENKKKVTITTLVNRLWKI
jgi:5-methylcytosine-specific restriction protein A